VPLFDYCSNAVSTKSNPIKPYSYKLKVLKTGISVSIQHTFNEGEEIKYFYKGGNLDNASLVYSYGYYNKDNVTRFVSLNLTFKKKYFTKEKHDICVELKCFEGINYEHEYKDNTSPTLNLHLKIYPKFNNAFLNIYRLLFLSDDKVNEYKSFYTDELKKEKFILYDNEMKSRVTVGNHYKDILFGTKPNFHDYLEIKQTTRNYHKQNKALFDSDPKLNYIYNTRKSLFFLELEKREIILDGLNDNITKIMKYTYQEVITIKNKMLEFLNN